MPKNQRENRWEYRLKEQKVKNEIIAAQIEDIFKRDYERAEWDWLSDKKKRQKIRKNVESFWNKYSRVFLKNLFIDSNTKKISNLYQWAQEFDPKPGTNKDTNSWSYFSQNIKTLLPKCDAIIRTFPNLPNDWHKVDLDQLNRVVQLLFGNFHRTPTNDEHGLYMAYSAMLQSGELGRQVGAIVTNEIGDTLAIGYNEVPCFGGLCSEDNFPENRDYLETELTSMRYLRNSIQEIGENFLLFLKTINNPKKNNKKISKGLEVIISKSNFKDSIEHFRSVHAEMGALVNAAKSGVAVKGSTMYVTTFPCHLCIKHIIASGISRVVYLEPYEKSQTEEYYRKSIVLNPDSDEKEKIIKQNTSAKEKSKVVIEHFTGVLPNRYKNLFYYPHDLPRFAKKMNGKPRQWSSQTSDPTFRVHGSFLKETGYKFWEIQIIQALEDKIKGLDSL